MTETTLMALKGKEQKEQKRLYDASHVTQSGEDYLETILILQKKGMVRSVDLARHMGFSKPSICHAVKVLKQGGFLTMDGDGYLHLTDEGREVAESIYEKHQFFTDSLIEMGVDPKQAEADAC